MRLPKKPPKLHDLLRRVQLEPDLLTRLLGLGATQAGRYLHWDKLRHRPPPPGLTHEQWWLGIKLARRSSRLSVPLVNEDGVHFSFITHDVVSRKLHDIDRRSGHIKTFEPELRGPATRSRYIISSLAEEAITSSQLEGASTTRLVAKEMLRTGRKPVDASERMILRNYEAMQFATSQKDQPLTRDLIVRLHEILDPDHHIRTPGDEVHVIHSPSQEIIHTPPLAGIIEESLGRLCEFANQDDDASDSFLHPVLRSIAIHFWVGFLHPFTDGNGRTARALFYWSMLRRGYWLWEYIPISTILRKAPSKYARSYLYSENDEGDLTYFMLYHMGVMLRALDNLESYMRTKTRELQELHMLLNRGVDLNHRQLALLNQAIKDPDTVFSFRSHQNSHGVVYQTSRSDILQLVDLGLLKQYKMKRRMLFRAVKDLDDRIRTRYDKPRTA